MSVVASYWIKSTKTHNGGSQIQFINNNLKFDRIKSKKYLDMYSPFLTHITITSWAYKLQSLLHHRPPICRDFQTSAALKLILAHFSFSFCVCLYLALSCIQMKQSLILDVSLFRIPHIVTINELNMFTVAAFELHQSMKIYIWRICKFSTRRFRSCLSSK